MANKLILLSQVLLVAFVASSDDKTEMFGVVDKPLTLSCPLPMSDPPQLKWKDWVHTDNRHAAIIFNSQGNTNRVPESRHSQSDNYEIDEELRLTIKQFRSIDVGAYACESTVNKTKLEHKFTVNSVGDFKCDGKTAAVKEGEPLELICHAVYRGQLPTIAWYRGETIAQSNEDIDFGTADYTINSPGQPDMDGVMFTCRMVYGQDMVEECEVKVSVTYTVRNLTFHPSKTEYNAKDKIKVMAQGNPTPKVSCTVPGATEAVEGEGMVEITVKEEWVGETNEIRCTAMNTVDNSESQTESEAITFTTSGHKHIPEPTAKAKAGDKRVAEPKEAEAKPDPEAAVGGACGIYETPIESRALLLGVLVTFVLSQASLGQMLLVASLPLLLGKALYDNSMIIIICIVVAIVILIIIVVAVICVRRKNSQKRQRLPTKEEEVRRLEDGKA